MGLKNSDYSKRKKRSSKRTSVNIKNSSTDETGTADDAEENASEDGDNIDDIGDPAAPSIINDVIMEEAAQGSTGRIKKKKRIEEERDDDYTDDTATHQGDILADSKSVSVNKSHRGIELLPNSRLQKPAHTKSDIPYINKTGNSPGPSKDQAGPQYRIPKRTYSGDLSNSLFNDKHKEPLWLVDIGEKLENCKVLTDARLRPIIHHGGDQVYKWGSFLPSSSVSFGQCEDSTDSSFTFFPSTLSSSAGRGEQGNAQTHPLKLVDPSQKAVFDPMPGYLSLDALQDMLFADCHASQASSSVNSRVNVVEVLAFWGVRPEPLLLQSIERERRSRLAEVQRIMWEKEQVRVREEAEKRAAEEMKIAEEERKRVAEERKREAEKRAVEERRRQEEDKRRAAEEAERAKAEAVRLRAIQQEDMERQARLREDLRREHGRQYRPRQDGYGDQEQERRIQEQFNEEMQRQQSMRLRNGDRERYHEYASVQVSRRAPPEGHGGDREHRDRYHNEESEYDNRSKRAGSRQYEMDDTRHDHSSSSNERRRQPDPRDVGSIGNDRAWGRPPMGPRDHLELGQQGQGRVARTWETHDSTRDNWKKSREGARAEVYPIDARRVAIDRLTHSSAPSAAATAIDVGGRNERGDRHELSGSCRLSSEKEDRWEMNDDPAPRYPDRYHDSMYDDRHRTSATGVSSQPSKRLKSSVGLVRSAAAAVPTSEFDRGNASERSDRSDRRRDGDNVRGVKERGREDGHVSGAHPLHHFDKSPLEPPPSHGHDDDREVSEDALEYKKSRDKSASHRSHRHPKKDKKKHKK